MVERIGYRRVSSVDQNTDRQLDGLTFDQVFEDKVSGGTRNRPALIDAIKHCRKGDTFVVHSMDRLARNLGDLLSIVKDLTAKKVSVQFVKENLTFTGDDSPMATLMLQIMGSCAQFERSMILERQREGIRIAKAKGKFKGRKRALTPEQVIELRKRAAARTDSMTDLAEEFGVSRQTAYAAIKGYTGKIVV
jgi:DNA invertase Pin-like site-specific DNA recombinase